MSASRSGHEIRIAREQDEIARCHPVMRQLRPRYSMEAFVQQVLRQMEQSGYEMAYVDAAGRVPAVAGFRISECLAWGCFMYVDDLVTHEADRSRGFGEALLLWLIDRARQAGCDELHLDSGVQRFAAHRFYLRQRMDITSHHFVLQLRGAEEPR